MHLLLQPLVRDAAPLEAWCYAHLSRQFQHMSKEQIWDKVAILQNAALGTKTSRKRKREHQQQQHSEDTDYGMLPSGETIHTCQECGGHDVIMNQAQVRGADEPMTCFYYCRACGETWREE